MQPGVIEKVVEVALAGAVRSVLYVARRERLPGQHVVDDDTDAVLGTELDNLGHVGLERRVAALVLGDLGAVQPDHGSVGRRAEPQYDPFADPGCRHTDRRLVPGIADVVVHRRVGEDVVIAGGHRHLPRPRWQPFPPLLVPAALFGVGHEPPQAVQGLALPGRRVSWCEHVQLLT